MSINDQSPPVRQAGISRRTLAVGTAWAAPVLAMAAAAPAMAVSGQVPVPTYIADSGCKWPGASCSASPKGYYFGFKVCNNSGLDIYLYGATLVATSGTTATFSLVSPAMPYHIAPNTCDMIYFGFSSNNSADLSFEADLTISWGHNTPGPDPSNHPPTVTHVVVNGTPPCDFCGWQATHAYSLGNTVVVGAMTFAVTTAGTSGSTQPNWASVAIGGTIADGTVVWTRTA